MSRNAMRLAVCLLLIILSMITLEVVSGQEQIEVIVNNVVVEASSDGTTHQVTIYVTVAGTDGQPISGLTADAFAVTQDGSSVVLDSVVSTQRSLSVVLAIDTSGGMAYQGKMEAVKTAAADFLDHLRPTDQVGVVFFGDRVVVGQQDLTSDIVLTKNIVRLLQAEPNAGTCLHDALYKAIGLAGQAPQRSRMLVLLTDGVDERADLSGKCSQHTVDEVIGLAQGVLPDTSDTRVPIYTIGVGDLIDVDELESIAASTGGASLTLSDPAEVAVLFDTIAAQMQNRYELAYQVVAAGGVHNLTVSIGTQDIKGMGTGLFLVPEPPPPPTLSLNGLDDGAVLSGRKEVRAAISDETDVTRVVFMLDSAPLLEVTEAPFSAQLDAGVLLPGQHELAVTAQLGDGTVLSETLAFEVHSELSESVTEETISGVEMAGGPPGWLVPVGVVGAVALFSLGTLAFIRSRSPIQVIGRGAMASGRSGGTVDLVLDIAKQKYATLRVQDSLTLHRDQAFDLATSEVTIGRGADNNVVVPDDPVSRMHAVVRREGDEFRVFDCDSDHGTFVNGVRVEEAGLPIQDGDILLLGTRTAMVFHVLHPEMVIFGDEDYDTGAEASEIAADELPEADDSDGC